jgi:hypothetical protein
LATKAPAEQSQITTIRFWKLLHNVDCFKLQRHFRHQLRARRFVLSSSPSPNPQSSTACTVELIELIFTHSQSTMVCTVVSPYYHPPHQIHQMHLFAPSTSTLSTPSLSLTAILQITRAGKQIQLFTNSTVNPPLTYPVVNARQPLYRIYSRVGNG